jgi:hypothetical protein
MVQPFLLILLVKIWRMRYRGCNLENVVGDSLISFLYPHAYIATISFQTDMFVVCKNS